jgi:uncharacterized protein YggT (Ycf19 family)
LALVALRAASALLSAAGAPGSVPAALVGVIAQVVLGVILLLTILVGVRLVLSAFKPSPWNPAVRFVDRASEPLLRPFARLARSAPLTVVTLIALAAYFGLYLLAGVVFFSLQRLVA